MTTIQIHLDDATWERIRIAAAAAGQTPSEFVAGLASQAAATDGVGDPLVGWLADEPEVADAIDDAARRSRNERLNRHVGGTDAASAP